MLEQLKEPRWIGLDTMVHWIRERRGELLELVAEADVVFVTAVEARLLAEHTSIPGAVERILEKGPKAVVVKRGSRGAWLMSEDGGAVAVPAVAVPEVRDPTGAGDAFAGAFMGVLESRSDDLGLLDLRDALRHASAVASFAVEQVSVEGFRGLSREELDRRLQELTPTPNPPAPEAADAPSDTERNEHADRDVLSLPDGPDAEP